MPALGTRQEVACVACDLRLQTDPESAHGKVRDIAPRTTPVAVAAVLAVGPQHPSPPMDPRIVGVDTPCGHIAGGYVTLSPAQAVLPNDRRPSMPPPQLRQAAVPAAVPTGQAAVPSSTSPGGAGSDTTGGRTSVLQVLEDTASAKLRRSSMQALGYAMLLAGAHQLDPSPPDNVIARTFQAALASLPPEAGTAILFAGLDSGAAEATIPEITSGSQVTEGVSREAMKDAPLISQQLRGVSLPMIREYVDKLLAGEVAPAIKVDGQMIVDGNHRYIVGRILGQEPAIQMWLGGRPANDVPWSTILINPEAW